MVRRTIMRAAAYVRVSTSRQVKLQTIEQQLERVQKHAQEKGWDLPQENIFRDDGYSGTTLKRPALDALRDKTRLRELEVVVVLSPDRLARNYVHQMVLIEELEKGGCRVEFVERPMSSEPDDQLLLQIRGAVAEYERTLLSERMRRGRLAKYKAGLLLPWTHTPYGYRVDPDRPRDPAGVRPDEPKAAVVAEIFAMYLERLASQMTLEHYEAMNAYSEDLRKKIVEALRRGMGKSEAARSFGVSLSSVKRYARMAQEGRPLAPKKRPGSKPKMDESARRILESDMEERPAATLPQRREYLQKIAGLKVSESTVSRMLKRMGWSRKKDRWVRASATSS
jgi:DNA invertase Pin-like site-specific DNA recombinase